MEKKELEWDEQGKILWKKAEQSFVCAYDFAVDVAEEKRLLTPTEFGRLLKLLKLWLGALKNMLEAGSDSEMEKDFQLYYDRISQILKKLEDKFC